MTASLVYHEPPCCIPFRNWASKQHMNPDTDSNNLSPQLINFTKIMPECLARVLCDEDSEVLCYQRAWEQKRGMHM